MLTHQEDDARQEYWRMLADRRLFCDYSFRCRAGHLLPYAVPEPENEFAYGYIHSSVFEWLVDLGCPERGHFERERSWWRQHILLGKTELIEVRTRAAEKFRCENWRRLDAVRWAAAIHECLHDYERGRYDDADPLVLA